METLSRRSVLILGATGAAVAVGGGLVLWSQVQGTQVAPMPTASAPPEPPASDSSGTLREPEILSSSAGVLDLTLTAAMTEITVAGARVRALTYNGTLPGPTLRVRPGDRIRLTVRNELDTAMSSPCRPERAPSFGSRSQV